MMEQKKYNQIDTKTPDIQSMILSYQIGGISYELSQRLDISPFSCPRPLLQKQDLQAVARQADGIVLDEQWLCSR